jgi:hypothetical protein
MSKTVDTPGPDVEKMKEFKVLVAGDGAVGKVSLRVRVPVAIGCSSDSSEHHRRAS